MFVGVCFISVNSFARIREMRNDDSRKILILLNVLKVVGLGERLASLVEDTHH